MLRTTRNFRHHFFLRCRRSVASRFRHVGQGLSSARPALKIIAGVFFTLRSLGLSRLIAEPLLENYRAWCFESSGLTVFRSRFLSQPVTKHSPIEWKRTWR